MEPKDLPSGPYSELTTLPNGFRVASAKTPHNDSTATVGVWIETGSRFESPSQNGCAHFLEHLAFKGTTNRSRVAMEREIENMGGHLNAYTSRELTTYFSSVLHKDIPQAVDILSDILRNPKITPESVESERATILNEATEVYKDLEEYVFDYLHETAFMNNALGQTILGPRSNIEKISRNDLMQYMRKHYVPEKMVLVGAGAVDHGQLVRLAQEKFGSLKNEAKELPSFPPSKYTGGDYRERQDDIPLAHLAIAYETCGWTNPDTIPLLFLHALIGSWQVGQIFGAHSSSRLISTFASYRYGEKVMPFNTLYKDTGLFGIYASVYEARLAETGNCLMNALGELIYDTTDEHVEHIRNSLTSAAFSALETSSQICEELGRQVLTYGRMVPPREFLARLNAVDAAAVRDVAHRYINDRDHSMAAVGPIVELLPYSWFRRRSYKLFR